MIFVNKYFLFVMFSEQSIITASRIIVYTFEGSTINLPFKADSDLHLNLYKDEYYPIDFEANKYDIIYRQNIIEFEIINVTANDTGIYWIDFLSRVYTSQLSITGMFIFTCYMFLLGSICVR